MKMARLGLLGVVGVVLCGCGTVTWSKPGASAQQYNADTYACERDARMSGYFGGGIPGLINMEEFQERCMVAHGWMKVGDSGG